MTVLYTFGGSAFATLFSVFGRKMLDLGPVEVGYLWSALGVGLFAMSIGLVWLTRRELSRGVHAVAISSAVAGAALWGLVWVSDHLLAGALMGIIGAGKGALTPIAWGVMQEIAPGHMVGRVGSIRSYDRDFHEAEERLETARANDCAIETSNTQFNEWLDRSFQDIHMMVTDTREGLYPYAGLPWFNAPFGRDGIITALECLWFNSEIAKGVLTYLVSTQATQVVPEQDAEPGKILHESRRGEMAALGEVPFGCYYGSIDATPLFVVLAGAYYERTGDVGFIKAIWPHITRALEWMDTWGDRDGDGFVEYARQSHNGLVHQGWKDSSNAVFHADGRPAVGPIALCEVQGYV